MNAILSIMLNICLVSCVLFVMAWLFLWVQHMRQVAIKAYTNYRFRDEDPAHEDRR